MSEYEIEIYNISDEEMSDVQVALTLHGVGGDDRDDIGMYLRDGSSRSVFVQVTEVSKAVMIINGLGYQTDEDVDDGSGTGTIDDDLLEGVDEQTIQEFLTGGLSEMTIDDMPEMTIDDMPID